MTDEELRVAHAESKKLSELLLDPVAYRALAEERAARVEHRTDGFSCDWAATMPTKAEPVAEPSRTFTDAQIARKIASVQAEIDSKLAELPRALTADQVRQIAHDLISSVAEKLVENIARTFASRNQIKELRDELAGLRVDLAIEKAHAGDGAKVIDMPSARRG